MKLSTEISSTSKHVGEEKAIELIAKAGFDHWDFTMCTNMCIFDWEKRTWTLSNEPLGTNNYLKFAKKLKDIGLYNGITCNQSHAPFPVDNPFIYDYLMRSIECTAEAGGKICIIHPDNFSTPEKNAEMYNMLLEFAKPFNVKIATENMWGWDDKLDQADFAACSTPESFHEHFKAVNNDENLVACLDIGHAEMRGLNTSAVDMIYKLGDKLQALHVHDNDKWHDSHQIPMSMNIDFYPIMKALKDVNYKGELTLESDAYLRKFNKDNVFEGVKDLYNSAKKLSDLFENF
ncbi:MAG: sugar phosphate isomerase/epimerase [Clostridia bacterium]|nr:sugar phosphate isomerase/epimerase [Clostridia bacterium]